MSHITIEGFEALTQQQLFDMSAKHIIEQGKPGQSSSGTCSYKAGCAASIFIKHDERSYADDSGSWEDLEIHGDVPETHSDFVERLQICHDRAAIETFKDGGEGFIADWSARMQILAKQYNLNTDALTV